MALAGHTGSPAIARAALVDPAPAVRATALAALSRLGGLAAAEWDAAMGDPAPEVRRRACELGAAVGSRALAPLVGAVADSADSVAEAACFALGEVGGVGSDGVDPGAAVTALSAAATTHRDPLVREAAVAALGAIGDPGGLDAILAATADKPAVRRRAVLALAPFEGAAVDAALAKASQDRDWQVRQAAEDLGAGAPGEMPT